MIEQIKKALENTTVEGHREIEDNASYWLRYLIGEVERYRTEAKNERELSEDIVAERERLYIEVEELRKALEEISTYPPFEETNNGDRFYEQMREKAMQALERTKP